MEPLSPDALSALIRELAALAPDLPLVQEPGELAALSRDAYDYSPVLVPQLQHCRAQLGVRASRVEQVERVAGACARHGVPLTVRGAGTGNYGQCVPLAGGVVLDLSGLRQVRQIEADSGVVTVEAGCPMAQLERALAADGRSLRLAPSTLRTATIGGFIAGGSGGIGSLRWGFLRDPGHLLGLEVITVEPTPRRLQLDAVASRPLNHAYGTNGILTALRLASTEAVAWRQVVAGFPHWDGALEAARSLPTTALLLNSLCLLEAPIAAHSPWPTHCPGPEDGEHRLLLLAAPDSLELLPALLAAHGGQLRWQEPQGSSQGLPLRELTWNHTTLHWRARHPDWTYLQLLLPQPEAPLLNALRRDWGESVLWHLEGVRQQGCPRLAAIPVLRWQGEEALERLMGQCRDLGAVLFNPHVLTVEDGGLGVIDADQVACKAAHDPAGLFNPGKLRGWLSRSPG